jgi:hypothetical protein
MNNAKSNVDDGVLGQFGKPQDIQTFTDVKKGDVITTYHASPSSEIKGGKFEIRDDAVHGGEAFPRGIHSAPQIKNSFLDLSSGEFGDNIYKLETKVGEIFDVSNPDSKLVKRLQDAVAKQYIKYPEHPHLIYLQDKIAKGSIPPELGRNFLLENGIDTLRDGSERIISLNPDNIKIIEKVKGSSSKVDDGVLGQFGKETDPMNFKTADEFKSAFSVREMLKKNNITINADDTVTLYHASTPDRIASMKKEGVVKGGTTAAGGMTGLDLKPSAFFGADKKWVSETWGGGGDMVEIKVPFHYLRQPAQNTKEVYFEGGLKLVDKDKNIWKPTTPPRDTFYNRIPATTYDHTNPDSKLTDTWNKAHKVDDGVLGQKPVEGVHLTMEEFDDFKMGATRDSEPGIHFGTNSASGEKLIENKKWQIDNNWIGPPDNPVISPQGIKKIQADLNISKPLRLYEEKRIYGGRWDGHQIAKRIFEVDDLPKGFTEADRIAFENEYLSAKVTIYGENIDVPMGVNKDGSYADYTYGDLDVKQESEWINNFLKERGYDHIIYDNAFEGGGDSIGVYDLDKIKQTGSERYAKFAIPTGGVIGGEEETQSEEELLPPLATKPEKPMTSVLSNIKTSKTVLSVTNNNPGNIKATNIKWDGMIGKNGDFVEFDNPENGIRALTRDLTNKRKRGLDTITKIINAYAPPTENDTKSYIKDVAKDMGLSATDKLSDKNMYKMIKAMTKHEGGKEALKHFTDAIIKKGMKSAYKNKYQKFK